MVAALRLAAARAPRHYARTFVSSAAHAQGQRNNWDDAVNEYNKSFDAGVKDAASEVNRELDAITANADTYAKSIAERLKAVFGDSAPSAKDVKSELQRQAKIARYALQETEQELGHDSQTRDKIDQRLRQDFDDFNSKRSQN